MGESEESEVRMMRIRNISLFLLGVNSVLALAATGPKLGTNQTTCPTCLLVKSSYNTQNVFPWLFNNDNTRFVYTYTDGRGWPTYQYVNSQGEVIYLHFYDEGLFYDGFYVINDLETEYEEEDGRVFIYNSDSDDCPTETGRNWYYWAGTKWVWDDSINLTSLMLSKMMWPL